VKFLVDVNLPPRLCQWLGSHGHPATHLAELLALQMPDTEVWKRAATYGEVLVSKDGDFYERALIQGPPPQVLLVAVGNCGNDDLFKMLEVSWQRIELELEAGARLLVLRRNRLEIY
jgi:predicted nuclease of predicted toxin-antitoxin system